jgi:hypothetical protein
VVALIGGALWRVYDGTSASLHAEKGLHATQFTFEAIEDYVRKHNGAWPRSWKELERSSPQMDDVYRWTGGSYKVQEFVSVDFDADPDRLAKQTEEEFQAIRPVGPFYGSYRIEIPFMLEALRQTRELKPRHAEGRKAPEK